MKNKIQKKEKIPFTRVKTLHQEQENQSLEGIISSITLIITISSCCYRHLLLPLIRPSRKRWKVMTTHIHMKMDSHIRIIASIIVKPPNKHTQLSLSGAVTKGSPHSLPQHLGLTP